MTQLLHNAAAGTALILAVALLRRTLKDRLIPEVRLVLWAACLFRLLTPFAPEQAGRPQGQPYLGNQPVFQRPAQDSHGQDQRRARGGVVQ